MQNHIWEKEICWNSLSIKTQSATAREGLFSSIIRSYETK